MEIFTLLLVIAQTVIMALPLIRRKKRPAPSAAPGKNLHPRNEV